MSQERPVSDRWRATGSVSRRCTTKNHPFEQSRCLTTRLDFEDGLMRPLLGGCSPAVVSLVVGFEIFVCPHHATAQPAGTGAPTKPPVATARAVLQASSNGDVALNRKSTSRLESAQ